MSETQRNPLLSASVLAVTGIRDVIVTLQLIDDACLSEDEGALIRGSAVYLQNVIERLKWAQHEYCQRAGGA